jgi:hypothetical protein
VSSRVETIAPSTYIYGRSRRFFTAFPCITGAWERRCKRYDAHYHKRSPSFSVHDKARACRHGTRHFTRCQCLLRAMCGNSIQLVEWIEERLPSPPIISLSELYGSKSLASERPASPPMNWIRNPVMLHLKGHSSQGIISRRNHDAQLRILIVRFLIQVMIY